LPSATIKYYLRSGLLRPGATQSSTWATYDETHLHRLRLIQALTDVAGLSLDEVRGVLDAVEASESDHQARGAAQWPLADALTREPSAASVERVDRLLVRHHWRLNPRSPYRRALAAALDTLDELGFAATDEVLDAYALALEPIARIEVARVAADPDPVVAAERVVIGTLLYEPVLLTLRRMAHEAVSARS
jgi:DNA-binding transcriptional MerR regulator